VSTVRIPPVLRPEIGGRRSVDVDASTVGDALERLVVDFPSLRGRVLPDGALPAFVNVFVDGDDVRMLDGLETPLRPESTILLLPAVAGGADP
jgi:molybdopterin converting factor small subunit